MLPVISVTQEEGAALSQPQRSSQTPPEATPVFSQPLVTFLEEFCRWRCSTLISPADGMDWRRTIEKGVLPEWARALHHVMPFCFLMRHPAIQLLFVGFGAALLYLASDSLIARQGFVLSRHQMYRLVSTQPPRLGSFFLLFGGCKVDYADSMPCNRSHGTNCVLFSQPVLIDGFEVQSMANTTLDGTRIDIEGSSDGGSSWRLAGSSSFRWVRNGVRFLQQGDARGGLRFDMRAPWPSTVVLFVDFLIGLVLPLTALAGTFGKITIAKRACLALVWIMSLAYASAAIGYLVAYSKMASVLYFLYAALAMSAAITVHFQEAYIFEVAIAIGGLGILARIISDCACLSDCDNLRADPPVLQLVILLCGMVLTTIRRRNIAALVQDFNSDQSEFDAYWLQIKSLQGSEALQNLEVRVSTISRYCIPGQARHFHRQVKYEFDSSKRLTTERNRDLRAVSSLQQLFVQAIGLASILHRRCVDWAFEHRGALRSADIDYRMPAWFGGTFGPSCECWIRLGYVKRPERALAKLILRYRNDPSKLIDVCRHRIVFDSVNSLGACLADIESDPSITIERIKSSLCEGDSLPLKGGFRAVILNIRICDSETQLLGLECHVCELQLLLRGMDNLHDVEKHARYVQFRDSSSVVSNMTSKVTETDSSNVIRTLSAVGLDLFQIQSDVIAAEDAETNPSPASNHLESPESLVEDKSPNYNLPMTAYKELFVWSTLEPTDSLHRMLRSAREAMHRSSASSAMFTSEPLVAMMSKRVFQAFLVLLTLYCAAYLFMAFYPLSVGLFAPFSRLQVQTNNQNDTSLAGPPIALFRLYSGPDRCLVDNATYSEITMDRNTANVTLTGALVTNGYYVETKPEFENRGEVVVSLTSCSETGELLGPIARAQLQMSKDSSGRVLWSLQGWSATSWMWDIRYVGSVSVGVVGFSSTLFLAVIGREPRAATVLMATLWGFSGCYLLPIFGYCSRADYLNALSQTTYLVPYLVLSAGLTFAQKHAIAVLLFFGASNILWSLFRDLAAYRIVGKADPPQNVAIDVFASPGTLAFVFGAVVLTFRQFTLRRAQNLVLKDKKRYDVVWKEVSEEPGAKESLDKLQAELIRLEQSVPRVVVRQLNRRAAPQGEQDNAYGAGLAGFCDPQKPIRDLDRLYFQARCIHSIFLDKVRNLAAKSGGGGFVKAPSHDPDVLVRVSSHTSLHLKYSADGKLIFVKCQEDSQQDDGIRWSHLKSSGRAVEKIIRSYQQDVSRLVDVCRQQIIFEDLDGLLRCVDAIINDEEIVVVRVKNRFKDDYDSATSAGYRDVGMNVRILSEKSKKLGVETHVCELQLSLISFASIKSQDGHKRYVSFRNLRGE